MPEIREVQIRSLDIPPTPEWMTRPSDAIPPVVPVTQQIGTPIVDLPGCVEAHSDSGKSKTLAQEDLNGVMTYCDGTLPSFRPMDFSEEAIPTPTVKTPEYKLKVPKIPEVPDIPKQEPSTVQINCPTPSQEAKEPIGTLVQGFRKKVTGYKLVGNECIQITEKIPIPEQIIAGLPSPGAVMTTGGIAVVATASALAAKPLADILLKAVKPTVKKVMKKLAKIRGKEVVFLSVAERRAEQRERNHAIKELRSALKPKG